MKLTALDIHHKEFGHSLRGYSEEQVDGFLDQVADEFERLFKENIDLAEKLEAANDRVHDYQRIETSINATLLQAQRSAEDVVRKADADAEAVLRDAELKAKEIVHNALQRKQAIANELVRIKQAEEEFRSRYKALLEDKLHSINEIRLPEDVTLMIGETDEGVVGEVTVRPSQPAPVAPPMAAPVAAPQPVAPPVAAAVTPAPVAAVAPAVAEPSPAPEAAEFFDQATIAMDPIPEPPAPGFVESVSLGELAGPDLEPDVKLVEPGEFNLPGFGAFGEREDDHDIEEID
ncbi:MAG: DivIVA domain-containing protein [Coriobacteriia bacterium]|nr:DivIVA domain-containing protein [Coriobacteriia bacterium]